MHNAEKILKIHTEIRPFSDEEEKLKSRGAASFGRLSACETSGQYFGGCSSSTVKGNHQYCGYYHHRA